MSDKHGLILEGLSENKKAFEWTKARTISDSWNGIKKGTLVAVKKLESGKYAVMAYGGRIDGYDGCYVEIMTLDKVKKVVVSERDSNNSIVNYDEKDSKRLDSLVYPNLEKYVKNDFWIKGVCKKELTQYKLKVGDEIVLKRNQKDGIRIFRSSNCAFDVSEKEFKECFSYLKDGFGDPIKCTDQTGYNRYNSSVGIDWSHPAYDTYGT